TDKVDNFSYKCIYIKARDAERVLKELLGDPAKLIAATQPQGGPGGGFGGGGNFGGNFGGGDGGNRQQRPNQQGGAAASNIRMHYITSDDRTNTVLVTGPADKLAQARDIMKKIDVKTPGKDSPILTGDPELKKYNVEGNAQDLARTLKDIYKESNTLR